MMGIQIPGSKSMTHRAYILAANSSGLKTIVNPLVSDDTNATLSALNALGAQGAFDGTSRVCFGRRIGPKASDVVIDCGNSGTTLRLMLGQAARFETSVKFVGDASLSKRPNGQLIRCLEGLGPDIIGKDTLPIEIRGPMAGGRVQLDAVRSSQYISSLLMAMPYLDGDSEISVTGPILSHPYVELTRSMLEASGVRIAVHEQDDALVYRVAGQQQSSVQELDVEGDWSSAAFMAVASLISGRSMALLGLCAESKQADAALLSLLGEFGYGYKWQGSHLFVSPDVVKGMVCVDLSATPDLFPALAVLAAATGVDAKFTGAPHLRFKESDRIHLMARGLTDLGCRVVEHNDGLEVSGPPSRPACIETEGDHRIQMAFELINLLRPGMVKIERSGAEQVSYPMFYKHLSLFLGSERRR